MKRSTEVHQKKKRLLQRDRIPGINKNPQRHGDTEKAATKNGGLLCVSVSLWFLQSMAGYRRSGYESYCSDLKNQPPRLILLTFLSLRGVPQPSQSREYNR